MTINNYGTLVVCHSDKSSEDLHYASDKTLIEALKKRGYKVTKVKKGKKQ